MKMDTFNGDQFLIETVEKHHQAELADEEQGDDEDSDGRWAG
jgi:hypothetical protein